MPNLQLPNPAQVSDQLAALLGAVLANLLNPPVVTVTPVNGGETDYDYVVVAETNGAVVPSAVAAITTGPAALSAAAYNSISWTPLEGVQTPVTYSVYRTTGGATQGLIASGLTGTSLNDTGLAAASATTPPFNTSGVFAASPQETVQVAAASGAITIVSGKVVITDAGVAALTLAQPIAGAASAGGHDGCRLRIYSTTAEAHTVTTPADTLAGLTYGPTKHIATFGGAIGDFVDLEAYDGVWWVAAVTGVTLS